MLLRSKTIFKKVTIIGVGFMGGSFGMAIKKHRLAREVVGVSLKKASLVRAIKAKAIDVGFMDFAKGVHNADLVVLAVPVKTILKLLPTINPHLKRGCIVTDLGSVKDDIVDTAEKTLSAPEFFVGSHPLTGSEKQGVEHSYAELFDKTQCIMTPTSKTNRVSNEKVKFLWTKMGAKVKQMSANEHDEILSYVSHLPHLLSFGLMETIPTESLVYTTQGLKDSTRIASSSPQIWNDICMVNSKNVLTALDKLVSNLSYMRKAIINKDQKALLHHFAQAKEKRDGITKSDSN